MFNTSTFTGDAYYQLASKLLDCDDEDFNTHTHSHLHLQPVLDAMRRVDKTESVEVSSVNPQHLERWQQYAETIPDKVEGHIKSHGGELGSSEDIINVLRSTGESLQHHIELGVVDTSSLDTFINNLIQSGVCVRGKVQQPAWKQGPEGYQKPYSVSVILNVPNLSKLSRCVKVLKCEAEMVKRHENTAYHFQIKPNANIIERKYYSTIVATYWINVPLPETTLDTYWTYGTSYITDKFPYVTPTLLLQLTNALQGRDIDINKIKTLITQETTDDTMYALLPPN